MKDKKKAAEEVQRLVNTNFTDKDLKIKISYEKEDSKADTSLLMVKMLFIHSFLVSAST